MTQVAATDVDDFVAAANTLELKGLQQLTNDEVINLVFAS
jgi:hypothetical protein